MYLKNKSKFLQKEKGITLIALVAKILFSYDEKIKCSNSKIQCHLFFEFIMKFRKILFRNGK